MSSPANTITKPRLRMPPSAAVLAEQQAKAEKLLGLESWTTEPSNPAQSEPGPRPVRRKRPAKPAAPPNDAAPPAPVEQPPAPPPMPWELPGSDAVHPYFVQLTEGLFQKTNYCWRRAGFKSGREFAIQALTEACDKVLKVQGTPS